MSFAQRIAEFAAAMRYHDLPDAVVEQTKRIWLDTIGCAIGGLAGDPSVIVRRLAETVRSSREATLIGSAKRSSADMAAFANGTALRYMDFNDTYTGRELGHPSDQLAAILAAAEIADATGKDVIVATVLAYEIFCRLCDAVQVRDRGLDYVTLGSVSTAAAVARLLRLREERIAETINLSLTPALALFETRIGNVSMWKACAAANVGRNALVAALLAEDGLTGPQQAFEGRAGLFAVLARSMEPEVFSRAEDHKILETSFKRFPVGHLSQTVVEAALDLRPQVGEMSEIKDIHIQTFQAAIDIMAGDAEKWTPRTRESADHSMPFAVASALTYGALTWDHFSEESIRNPDVLALTQKVRVTPSEDANKVWPRGMLARMDITMASGKRVETEATHHRGHFSNPMSQADLEEKFIGLARSSLGDAASYDLIGTIARLDSLPSMSLLATKLNAVGVG